MKIEDLNIKVEDAIRNLKDSYMQSYIDDVISIKYMPLRHNNNKKTDFYISPLHERSGMLYGNKLFIEYIGELMKRDFGHNYRAESVYTTFFGDKQYGDNSYIVLPFGGEYSMCYSEDIHDMYHVVPELKNNAFEKVYSDIKKSQFGNKDKMLKVWNDIEYELIHEMKKSISDYIVYLKNNNLTDEETNILIKLFEKYLDEEYERVIGKYVVKTDLKSVYSDVGKMYHPIIEIMLKSPRFLMVSYDYVMRNYRDVDYFFDAIK